MKHKVYKLFVDYEKEERWINEMAAKGLHLVACSFPQYIFEEGTPGEYTYRLELLENSPSGVEGRAYIKFVEEAGVECVDTLWRWAYFRKKAADGTFDVYTDSASKIRHYRRVAAVAGIGMIVNAAFAALYDTILLDMNVPTIVLNSFLALMLARVVWSFCSKARKLKNEMKVRE